MATPPLPPGFTLDQPQSAGSGALPPLPPGFTLDSESEQQSVQAEQPEAWQPRRPIQMAPAAAELGLMAGTGLVGQVAGGFAGLYQGARNLAGRAMGGPGGMPAADRVEQVSNALTYQPRGKGANAVLHSVGELAGMADERFVNPLMQRIGEVSPGAENVARTLPAAAEAVGTVFGGRALTSLAREGVAARTAARSVTPEEVLARQSARSGQSQGAAAAAPDITSVSDDLRQAVVAAGQRGGVNMDAVRRHVDADTLPVPVRLTEGQATGDVVRLSREQNMRAQSGGELARHYGEQNKALADNLRAFRDDAGPDVFSANVVEHGDSLIAAYRGIDDAANARIRDAYDALRQAAGGRFPIGAGTIVGKSKVALRDALITAETAPQSFSLLKSVEQFAAKPGSMRFEDFEALRTNLAAIQRSGGGLDSRAAGIIREQVENLPLLPGAERLKGLADQARALARQRFQAIDADPAYKAVVDGKVAPDDFVRKFVIGGKRDDIELMARTIPEAQQTMRVAALDHLRRSAGLNDFYEGNFSAPGFNKAWAGMSPKMKALIPPDLAENIEKLGRVASATTHQPRGSFVNNSNTFTAAAGEIAENSILRSVPVAGPLAAAARGKLRARDLRNEVRRITAPGAGIDHLPSRQ